MCLQLAHMLLEAGARTDMITKDEKTPWDIAIGLHPGDKEHEERSEIVLTIQRYMNKAVYKGDFRKKALPGAPLMSSAPPSAGDSPPKTITQGLRIQLHLPQATS